MAEIKNLFSRINLDFLLFDVLDVMDLQRFEFFKAHDSGSYQLVLDTATELGERITNETFMETDRKQPELKGGKVKVHQGIHNFVKGYCEAGFIAASFGQETGGFQIPRTILAAVDFILCSRANSFIMYTDLAKGIAHLIESFGSEKQKTEYLEHIFSGKWLGTMCLTETDCGSSLSQIATTAMPNRDGSYNIKGQKIFISAGDHDLSENIIHLVLARIHGAPEGTKGISLFIVPSKKSDGSDNDVSSIGIYHKMGQKATPAMHLEFGANDSCRGYLLGEANKGLQQMFQMMDTSRLSVGSMGAGIASAAYYHSLQYAKERRQGQRLGIKGPVKDQTTIIHHPDVRRMLLRQKAFVEGAIALVLQCYLYLDIQKQTATKEEYEKCTRLLNLLTPVAKTYGAEHGVVSVNQALQVLGGYGYTEDFPLEQLARDVRILPIYEGTSGIQALGLLNRHVLGDQGRKLDTWYEEVGTTLEKARAFRSLTGHASVLDRELEVLRQITSHIEGLSQNATPEFYLADASLYMEYFGILNIAWQWLNQGVSAQNGLRNKKEHSQFYKSKMQTLQYVFDYEMPKLKGLAVRLKSTSRTTLFDGSGEVLI